MRDDNDNGYKSTCANEETVDETGLPPTKELAYELSAEWVQANWPGLGRIWPGLVGSSLGWCLPADLGRAWAARLVRRASGYWPGDRKSVV